MKKFLLTMVLVLVGVMAFAQNKTVAVAGFEIQGGITPEEASVIYELFIAQLVSTGKVAVVDRVNLDRILTEMKFQASDWSNPEKTASLGRALSAQIIISGKLLKMGNWVYWTASMLDVNTARIMFSARERLNNIGQAWEKLPSFCNQLVAKINESAPNANLFTNVAVATFDVQGGITPAETAVVTELFISALVGTGSVNVIDRTNFDKILAEMRFQATDWSNRERTASLGRVLNAQNVIRGQLMKLGDTIFWTATVLDVNTAVVLSSARLQLTNLDQVWGDNLGKFSNDVVSLLPPPNLFIGRWRSSTKVNDTELVCILNIKADGTIAVERYDTITETENLTVDGANTALGALGTILTLGMYYEGTFYKSQKTYSSPNRSGTGSGTYSAITKRDTNRISTTASLNLNGIISGISRSPSVGINLSITSPNKLTLSSYVLYTVYTIRIRSGKEEKREIGNSYGEFTRLETASPSEEVTPQQRTPSTR
jgi:TolB-like protein